MKKNLPLLFSLLIFAATLFAQPSFNPVEEGNRQVGIQMMLVNTGIFNTESVLGFGSNGNEIGFHVAGSYGLFMKRGWMVGLQSNIGMYHQEFARSDPYGVVIDNFDISIAPMTRYYFSFDKKHRFKPFLFAGAPLVYSRVKNTCNTNAWNRDFEDSFLKLRGVLGVGAGYFGKAGNVELNVSNMGFFPGVNKFIQPKKK